MPTPVGRIHVYSVTEDTATIWDGDWTDALVSVRCKRFSPPLANAVDIEFARQWVYEMEKTPDIFCVNCLTFVHKAEFKRMSDLFKASQDQVRA